jgi:hypothetical protein
MQVRTVSSNSRTSNCQCGLFSKKNPIIRILCISGCLVVPVNPNKWSSAARETVSSNRFYSVRSNNSKRTRSEKKLDEIGARWRRFRDNHWLNLHSKPPRLHHKHELQQNRRIYLHIRQLWCANCTTQIVKLNWIFKAVPLWCAWWRNRLLIRPFLATWLGFFSVDTRTVRIGGTDTSAEDCKVLLRDVKDGVWGVMNEAWIIGTMFCWNQKSMPFPAECFSTVVHTANSSVGRLESVCCNRKINNGL